MFSLQENQRTRLQKPFLPGRRGVGELCWGKGELDQTMNTHISICKNDNKRGKKYCMVTTVNSNVYMKYAKRDLKHFHKKTKKVSI
jgi:hypothetical protein